MNKVNIRLVVLGVVVVAMTGAYLWIRNRPQDRAWIVVPPVNSKNMVAALMETPEGLTRLVTIKEDGAILEAKSKEGTDDQDFVWQKDGSRIVFVSNRGPDRSYQVFDWLPDRENDAYQITPNGASRSNLWMSPSGDYFLYTSRGGVYAIRYPKMKSSPVYPINQAPDTESQAAEGESVTAVSGEFKDLISQAWINLSTKLEGESFSIGYLDSTEKYFAGVYEGPGQQVLVLQDLLPQNEKEIPPAAPFAGEKIEVLMHPSEPLIIVSIFNFKYPAPASIPPDKINPDGTVKRDFVNAVLLIRLDGTKPVEPVFLSPNGNQAMVSATLSPDGTEIAFVVLEKVNGKLAAVALVTCPAVQGGVQQALPVARGNIAEPSWSADGTKLTFIRDGDIWTVQKDGSNEINLTKGKGKFRHPKFSPQS